MLTAGILILLALAALAVQRAYWTGREKTITAAWNQREDALRDELQAERDEAIVTCQRAVDVAERYKADLDWSRVVVATQGLTIDRGFLLPTIAGKRADAADNVVPLRGTR